MQKFTRALTREIELAGERLAVTLSEAGLSVRPVGSRRPPHEMSWAAALCVLAGKPAAGAVPTPEEIAVAVKDLKTGAPKPAKAAAEKPAEPAAAAPAPTPVPSAPHVTAPQAAPPVSPSAVSSDLSGLLGRIDRWLHQHRSRFQKGLLPGASQADLDHLQAALGKPLPPELRTLLSWHNGQNPDVIGAFEQSWNLMGTGEIAAAKKELDSAPADGWQPTWLPFLDDDAGDYLCLDVSQPGHPVRECWQGNPDHAVVAPSLTAWLEKFLHGLESGAYYEDPERGSFHRR
jgi:cell wall assembly regulator SMI1